MPATEPRPRPPRARMLTVSAMYGAGGSVIAPRLAEELGMPFFDRLIHTTQAQELRSLSEGQSDDELTQAPPGKLSARIARVTSALGMPSPAPDDVDPVGQMRRDVEASVMQVATGDGGVVLGRAAAVVAAALPLAFHVRLRGPAERCLYRGMTIEGVTLEVARQHQADTDRAWTRFVTRLFDRDPSDPRLYHLTMDTTVLSLDRAVELIATAAREFWARAVEGGTDSP